MTPPLCAMPARGAHTGIVGAANVGGGRAAGVRRLAGASNRLGRPVEQSPVEPAGPRPAGVGRLTSVQGAAQKSVLG